MKYIKMHGMKYELASDGEEHKNELMDLLIITSALSLYQVC